MATTGEECDYQKPIRNYFDSGYDLIFDAAMVHYCTRFREEVIPARRCGTCCPEFRPLAGAIHSPQTNQATVDTVQANDTRIQAFIQRYLDEACQMIEDSTKYLLSQVETRERHWKETDAWLSQPDTQTEALDHELVKAEQDYSAVLSRLQHIQRRLVSVKAGHSGSQDLEQLWLQEDEQERNVQRAKGARDRAAARVIERGRKEAELEQRFGRWEDALQRAPLLKRLRVEVERYVADWLRESKGRFSDSDIERILRFLKKIPRYTEDDIPLAMLKKTVEKLSHL